MVESHQIPIFKATQRHIDPSIALVGTLALNTATYCTFKTDAA